MAIVSPAIPAFEVGQDGSVTVTLSPAQSIAGWTTSAVLRAYNGGPSLATVTPTATDTVNGVWTILFTAAQLTLNPGSYVWEMTRTNSGFVYPIVEPSAFIIRPSSAGSSPTLTNLSELQAHMQLGTVSDTDAKTYLQLIFAAEAFVRRVCRRQFSYNAAYVEYLDGSGTDTVLLRERPVTAIVSVYLDENGYFGSVAGSFNSTTLQTSGTDYYLDLDGSQDSYSYSGRLRRIGRTWPTRVYRPARNLSAQLQPLPGCIKVTYSGGYVNIPYDLKLAIWQIVADRKSASKLGIPVVSESFQGYSYSLLDPDAEIMKIGSVRSILASYGAPTYGIW